MRNRTRRTRGIAAVALLAVAGVAGFLVAGTSANGATQSKSTVSLRSTSLGKILVDSRGRTVYLFEKDRSGRSACSGQCAKFWPPLISANKPTAGTGVKASLLGRTKRADGKMQVTYNRHPLYTFVQDTKAGQTKGQNYSAFGADWYAVTAKGVKAKGESAGGTTTSEPTTTSTYTYTQPDPGYGY
jgi:predicted lipoprotein with Yx(FWY)xxD motif